MSLSTTATFGLAGTTSQVQQNWKAGEGMGPELGMFDFF